MAELANVYRRAQDLVLDAWASLNHKDVMAPRPASTGWAAPLWVGDHQRRLTAYKVLQSYIDNCSRHFLLAASEDDKKARREYGDAALLVDVMRSALLGETVELVVEGAADALPEDPEPGALAAQEAAQARQELLRDWATAERLLLKLNECERNVIGLGDGIYTLGWSNAKRRPRLRVFDPGFYFPVLDDGDEDDYPQRIHIAWELPAEEGRPLRLRRITWELLPVEEWRPPYNAPDDPPATTACFLSDAVFTVEQGDEVDALSEQRADWQVNEDGDELRLLNLGIDFIPVVHVPNTVALLQHYGRAGLMAVAQILDDLQANDTDLQRASATTGVPAIVVKGQVINNPQGKVPTVGPGALYNVPEGGGMDVLDTSQSLTALLAYGDELLKRLSTNARIPQEVLGRVSAAEVPSGFAMALAFGPLAGLIDEMRLVREEKYGLLLKFAQRLMMIGGSLPAGIAEPANLSFGSYLPSDQPGTVSMVTQLLQAKAVSRLTALRMLIDAGLPIEDAEEEVGRIDAEDVEGATAFLQATGDEAATRQRLGLEGEGPRPAVPPIELAPTTGP